MTFHRPFHPTRRFLLATAVAGVAAGILSTLVQMALWLAFTDAFPAILWRDARLTAAIVLGPRVLPPPASFDWLVMAVASLLHGGLSLFYAFIFCLIGRWLGWNSAPLSGALLGMALYMVNLYGLAPVFPWFAVTRGWITLVAHIAFGMAATLTCRRLLHPAGRACPGGTGSSTKMSENS